MGKVDDLRAMREARYLAMQTGKAKGKGMQGQRVERVVLDEVKGFPSRSVERRVTRTDTPATGEALCGHQSISKKTCIRPKDHTEKNHRYAK